MAAQVIAADIAGQQEAELLEVAQGSPVLRQSLANGKIRRDHVVQRGHIGQRRMRRHSEAPALTWR